MSSKKKQEIEREEKDWNRVEDAVFESGSFLFKYQKQILIVVGIAVLVVGGIFAYQKLHLGPKTQEAQVAIFRGEQYFKEGKDSLALFGDGNAYMGFESIINDYGSTKVGDLAKYYAAISYSRLGQYDKAIEYLKSYKGHDIMTGHIATGKEGDCLINTGKLEDGAKKYMEAAKGADNNLLTPYFYKKAALVYLDLKNYDKVIELFTIIKNSYMNSEEAVSADKYIDEAKLLKGNV